MTRPLMQADHVACPSLCPGFLHRFVAQSHSQWEVDSIVPTEVWREAGRHGLLFQWIPSSIELYERR